MTPQPVEEYTPHAVYTLEGIYYVPHYLNENVFVGPGYGRHNGAAYSEKFLLDQGAKKEIMLLWHRHNFGVIKNVM
jgi:hypothetical protein